MSEHAAILSNEASAQLPAVALAAGLPSAAASAQPPPTSKGRSKAIAAAPLDPDTLYSVRQALSIISDRYPGLASLLQQSSSASSSSTNFILDQPIEVLDRLLTASAMKLLPENQLWVCWNKQDMASPPLKLDSAATKLHLTTTQYRGYRMGRATHGVKPNMNANTHLATKKQQGAMTSSSATTTKMYYYECVIGPAPSAKDVRAGLPAQVRLGPKLQKQLQEAAAAEEQEQQQQRQRIKQDRKDNKDDPPEQHHQPTAAKKQKQSSHETFSSSPNAPSSRIGGHVRLGFSMRTGDLQAPVGYDKWSYAISSTGGIVHASKRQLDWNQLHADENDPVSNKINHQQLYPGDVIGCAIVFDSIHGNHIRFFQNGQGLGNFIVAKGKRQGGEAFDQIEPGTYYPAVSPYMGGSVRANFGPHWICPPRKLPAALKKALEPMSSVCPPPGSPEEAPALMLPAVQLFAKKEHQQAFQRAISLEAQIQCQAYAQFSKNHLEWIRQMREERGLTVSDLPEPIQPQDEEAESVSQPTGPA